MFDTDIKYAHVNNKKRYRIAARHFYVDDQQPLLKSFKFF